MTWRVAASLLTLKAQVDAAWPRRNRATDGAIGDASHQTRESDHNPWIRDGAIGVVSAMDITNDPANGCDAEGITRNLRASQDTRIKYLIWNRRICNSSAIDGSEAWAWRRYTGKSPHDHHFHISVKSAKSQYDLTTPWQIGAGSAIIDPMGVEAMSRPLLKSGARGKPVEDLQRLLIGRGYPVEMDGRFGTDTETAVKLFQSRAGVFVDGEVGAKTWAALLA